MIEYPLALVGPDFNSWGASGIVYGALGVLLPACLQSLPAHLKTLSKERRRIRKRKKRLFDRRFLKTFLALVTLSLLFSFFWLIFSDPGDFLSAGPGVDLFAHGFGFLGGSGVLWFSSDLIFAVFEQAKIKWVLKFSIVFDSKHASYKPLNLLAFRFW